MKYLISKLKKISNDIVAVYQLYQVVRYVVSFLVSIIMVRSALPAIELGKYELFIFIGVSLSAFWSNGIKNALIAYYPSLTDADKKTLPVGVFQILSLIALFVSLALWVFPGILNGFDAWYLVPFIPIIILYFILSAPVALIENIFLLRNNVDKLRSYTMWSQSGIVVLTVLVAILNPTLNNFIFILIFWLAIRWLYLVFFVLDGSIFAIKSKQLKLFFLFSIPLILNMVLGSLMDMIDGLFVAHFFEPDYFPVFRYGAREMPLSSLLYSSLSVAMVPVLTQGKEGILVLRKKATQHLHLLAPLSLVLMVISPFIFPMIYNDNYRDSAFIFNIYLLILTSRVLLPQTVCLASHQLSIIVWSGIIEVIANVVLSFWWMSYWGVYGLAMGTVVAYMIQKIILLVYNYKNNGVKLGHYIDLRYYWLYMVLLIATFVITLFVWRWK